MPKTELRSELSRLRKALFSVEASDLGKSNNLSRESDPRLTELSSAGRVTLHEEIADILRLTSGEWMTTQEISEQVILRRQYRKKDGSDVTPFQIHGRTRNYPNIFVRNGSRVRLVRGAN